MLPTLKISLEIGSFYTKAFGGIFVLRDFVNDIIVFEDMEVSDAALLERWRNGDMDAGEKLFERYYKVLGRFFANKVGDAGHDLVQETFMACVAARDRVSDQSKFRPYLFSIAYHVLNGYLRKQYRGGKDVDLDQVSVCDLGMGPSSLVAKQQQERLLLEALRNIPVTYQVILELYYWEGMRAPRIASVLGMPEGTVRSRLRRARELLEDAMNGFAKSPRELEETLSHLDDWASELREQR